MTFLKDMDIIQSIEGIPGGSSEGVQMCACSAEPLIFTASEELRHTVVYTPWKLFYATNEGGEMHVKATPIGAAIGGMTRALRENTPCRMVTVRKILTGGILVQHWKVENHTFVETKRLIAGDGWEDCMVAELEKEGFTRLPDGTSEETLVKSWLAVDATKS